MSGTYKGQEYDYWVVYFQLPKDVVHKVFHTEEDAQRYIKKKGNKWATKYCIIDFPVDKDCKHYGFKGKLKELERK